MKVRLIYEVEVPETEISEQYDLLLKAVASLKKAMAAADSVDDLSDVFIDWYDFYELE